MPKQNPLTFQGKTQDLCEWARDVGIKYTTLYSRLHRGWSIEQALTAPVHARHDRNGKGRSPEYNTWGSMIHRCYSPHNDHYALYGGRGIKVCDRWRESFDAFLEDMGPRPADKTSLDRIDNNGDYTPENCMWSTMRQQSRNRRTNVFLTFQGRTMCLIDWAREHGIHRMTLYSRLKAGWPLKEALTTTTDHHQQRTAERERRRKRTTTS